MTCGNSTSEESVCYTAGLLIAGNADRPIDRSVSAFDRLTDIGPELEIRRVLELLGFVRQSPDLNLQGSMDHPQAKKH